MEGAYRLRSQSESLRRSRFATSPRRSARAGSLTPSKMQVHQGQVTPMKVSGKEEKSPSCRVSPSKRQSHVAKGGPERVPSNKERADKSSPIGSQYRSGQRRLKEVNQNEGTLTPVKESPLRQGRSKEVTRREEELTPDNGTPSKKLSSHGQRSPKQVTSANEKLTLNKSTPLEIQLSPGREGAKRIFMTYEEELTPDKGTRLRKQSTPKQGSTEKITFKSSGREKSKKVSTDEEKISSDGDLRSGKQSTPGQGSTEKITFKSSQREKAKKVSTDEKISSDKGTTSGKQSNSRQVTIKQATFNNEKLTSNRSTPSDIQRRPKIRRLKKLSGSKEKLTSCTALKKKRNSETEGVKIKLAKSEKKRKLFSVKNTLTPQEEKGVKKLCVRKVIGVMMSTEDSICDCGNSNELGDPTKSSSLHADKEELRTKTDDVENHMQALFEGHTFGIESPKSNSAVIISSPLQNDSGDLGFGVCSPCNVPSAALSEGPNSITSPGWKGVASVQGSEPERTSVLSVENAYRNREDDESFQDEVLKALTQITELLEESSNDNSEEKGSADERLADKPSRSEKETSQDDTPTTTRRIFDGVISSPNRQLENQEDPSERLDDNSVTTEDMRLELLLSPENGQIEIQESDIVCPDGRSINCSALKVEIEAASQDCTSPNGNDSSFNHQTSSIANGVEESNSGECSVCDENVIPNGVEDAMEEDELNLGKGGETPSRRSLNSSPIAINFSQIRLNSRNKRPLLEDETESDSNESKRRKTDGACSSNAGSCETPDLSHFLTDPTSPRTRYFSDANMPKDSSKTEWREGPDLFMISRRFVNKVVCINVIPNVEDLINEDSSDLLRGYCWDGCRGLSKFSSQLWRLDEHYVSHPYCKYCMKSNLKKTTVIDFWFKGKFKPVNEESTMEVIFSATYGAKFLGCNKVQYAGNGEARSQAHLRLKKLIEDGTPFDLEYIKVKSKDCEVLRGV